MARVGQVLVLVALLALEAGAGVAWTAVWASAASLDGSRAWWVADARAGVVALVGIAATGVVVLVTAVGGGLALYQPWRVAEPRAAAGSETPS
jgi:hypothetical protein